MSSVQNSGVRVLVPIVAAILASTGVGARAETISGHVDTRTRSGAGRGTVIVFAEPLDGPAAVRPITARLEQRNKAFRPLVLAVPVGSTVEFPNADPIFHNVFSLSMPEPFDLGLYRAGSSKTRTFARPGYYRVFCNIHPQMAAFIAVVPTSLVTLADDKGNYRLDLPRGRHRLTAVSDRVEAPASADFVAGGPAAPVLELDETGWVGITQEQIRAGLPDFCIRSLSAPAVMGASELDAERCSVRHAPALMKDVLCGQDVLAHALSLGPAGRGGIRGSRTTDGDRYPGIGSRRKRCRPRWRDRHGNAPSNRSYRQRRE
jgi:plastocyanin